MESKDEKTSLLSGSEDQTQTATPTNPGEGESMASGGARPKVRNPKEAKRRRFVLKQAKNISRTQLLESVSESEESQQQTLLQSWSRGDGNQSDQDRRRCPEFFGVRSYVHTFYEAMAMDSPHSYEDFGVNPFSRVHHSRKVRRYFFWKLSLWFGSILMGGGLVTLLVGYLTTKRNAVVGVQEDVEIIDRSDLAFNRIIDACKIAGIVVFCTGGVILSGVLFYLTFRRHHRMDNRTAYYGHDIPVTTRGSDEVENRPKTPRDDRVPATEELTTVQPRRSASEEVVLTNVGLCKIPS